MMRHIYAVLWAPQMLLGFTTPTRSATRTPSVLQTHLYSTRPSDKITRTLTEHPLLRARDCTTQAMWHKRQWIEWYRSGMFKRGTASNVEAAAIKEVTPRFMSSIEAGLADNDRVLTHVNMSSRVYIAPEPDLVLWFSCGSLSDIVGWSKIHLTRCCLYSTQSNCQGPHQCTTGRAQNDATILQLNGHRRSTRQSRHTCAVPALSCAHPALWRRYKNTVRTVTLKTSLI